MTRARTISDLDASRPQLTDQESTVREREQRVERPRQRSNSSLSQRLETKLLTANALLARLEPQDARARLLHIAVLRRDESLLEGILAELTAPPTARRSR